MYDRNRDLVFSFQNENRRYFDEPRYEVYPFFDPDSGRWCYELIDHNAFSLADLNARGGRLIQTNIGWCEYYLIEEILRDRYVDVIVEVYRDIDDWLDDREQGRWR